MLIELTFNNGVEHTFDTKHCRFDDDLSLNWEQEIRTIIGKERNYTITPNILDMDLPNVSAFVDSELNAIDAETAIKSLSRLCRWSDEDFCAFEAYIQETDDDSIMLENRPPHILWTGYASDRSDAISQYFDSADISAFDYLDYLNLDDAADELCEKLEIAMYKGLALQGFYGTAAPEYGKTPVNEFECDFVLTDQYMNQFNVKLIGDEFIVKAKNAKVKDLEEQIEVALTSGQSDFKISNFKSNAKLTGISKLEDIQFLLHNLKAYAFNYSYAFVCAVIRGTGSTRFNRDDFEYAFEAARDNNVSTNIRDAEQLYNMYADDTFEFSGSCYDWDRFEKDFTSNLAIGYCEEDNQWYVIEM